ncbi:hypothetical protein TraAM80_09294 [Trypanosoma rangeli]|uniref:Uncharacterized protein n=1 Tax=Trypanosoma rangeli TaxID=5698 RepID=A0A3R7R7X7_TRYRA|nr:uncharacterized protein TraAM80_09294 [Trypanosoma rangeli]RNE97500.1 hypothetical protein TraAM80_09294 [Trypanosoma rangeli]|eukprot:RNE97500.1 hypothetical protein TraAM80_09294 [Trypanosoma rangeli]
MGWGHECRPHPAGKEVGFTNWRQPLPRDVLHNCHSAGLGDLHRRPSSSWGLSPACVRACDRHLLLGAGASRTVNWAVGMMRRVSVFLLGRVLTPEVQTALHLLCPELALHTIHGV